MTTPGEAVVIGTGVRIAGRAVVGGTHAAGSVVVPPGGATRSLDDLNDFDGADLAPVDVPLVLRRGTDGVYRPIPLEHPNSWGDEIRYRPGPPTDVDAPVGAVQIDTTTGRGYRLHETGV